MKGMTGKREPRDRRCRACSLRARPIVERLPGCGESGFGIRPGGTIGGANAFA
ncbi:hypothetical protein [Burkholderia plantarii]|uniref:hypothetical protein n=1 Tax=Burkholderia plantarii TaxID=41899 RepID=UPI0018DC321F|nr:hypothetical protein [Burkholderia plantarii]MBI0330658.1 hypothetical protein [Burkholderia plantarii]